jgi:thymidylate synthase (FAD)
MRLIKPKVELINQEPGVEGLFKHMELCARTCYKSEDKITEDSAKKFINNVIIARGHTAMLEHGTVYLRYDFKANDDSNPIAYRLWSKYNENQYSEAVQAQPVPGIPDGFVAITTNYRVLLQNGWLEDLQYLCELTEYHVKRVTVRFICDMGVAREFCRHRLFSFAQESTRYCNYSKAKFGKELNCIIPCWYKNMFEGNSYNIELCHTYDLTISEGLSRTEAAWIQAMCEAESTYFGLLTEGEPAQQARNVLPLALKTELIMTGTVEQWIEFLKLRCANDAHPQARELAIELRDRLLLDDYIDIDAEGNLQVSNRY